MPFVVKNIILLAIICLATIKASVAQSENDLQFTGKVGVVVQFGTHLQRVGLSLETFVIYDRFQLSPSLRWHYHFKQFGPPQSGNELLYRIGAVIGYNGKDTLTPILYDAVANHTNYRYSLGYSFNQYFDEIGTNQLTGTMAFQVGRLRFLMENDAFAGPAADKFRTATALFQYRLDDAVVGVNMTLWTGDPFTNLLDTRVTDPNYKGRFGYRDMSKATHGQYSHGVLAGQVYYALPYQQSLRVQGGIDSEYVRHIFQNRIIHDTWYFPESWNKIKTPHIPMKDEDGNDYIFRSYQKVKPLKGFFDIGLNPTLFY